VSAKTLLVGTLAASVVAATACFASSEPDRPELSIEFPESVDAGSVHELVVDVFNPAPEAIDPLFVSFTWVGVGGAQDVPPPIVNLGSRGANSAVLEVSPQPSGVSTDGTVYRFGSLAEGGSTTITFTLRVPREPGVAANAVTVYDGEEIDRAKGVRLQTTVRR
jgi:hypothetical protein